MRKPVCVYSSILLSLKTFHLKQNLELSQEDIDFYESLAEFLTNEIAMLFDY